MKKNCGDDWASFCGITPDCPRALRRAKRLLRDARSLLAQAERFLHDLSDSQCPTELLEHIRRFNHAKGDTQ